MASASEELVLHVHGVLYGVDLESDEDDLDWLDRIILDAAKEPRHISELMGCFGLPARLIEDCIARLIEDHVLVLNVAKAQVHASGIERQLDPARSTETLMVWQDHVTGAVVPWDLVRVLSEADSRRRPHQTLLGGPPARSVLEMSDAELLTQIERYRPEAAWSERVVSKRRERVKTLFVTAMARESGGFTILDRLPAGLVRRWGRFADIGQGGEMIRHRVELPVSWGQLAGEWVHATSKRIDALSEGRAESEDAADATLGRIRAALERHARFDLVEDGPRTALASVKTAPDLDRQRRVLVAVTLGAAAWNDAIMLVRLAQAQQRGVLVGGGRPKATQAETVGNAGAELFFHGRTDVEFVLIDDRDLFVGGVQRTQPLSLRLTWSRPLVDLIGWLPDSARDRVLVGRRSGEEEARSDAVHRALLDLDGELRDLVKALRENASARPSERLMDRLRAELSRMALELNGLSPRIVAALDVTDVLALIDERSGGRVLTRTAASRLAVLGAGRHEVVVCSTERPAAATLWVQLAIPCELIVLEEVVIFGWDANDGPGDLPPFWAVHAPAVARQLLALTDRVKAIKLGT